jgi:hypothetical protein
VNLLNTVGAELNVGSEVLDALVLVEGRVDKGGLNDVLLALGGLEEGLGEAGTGHGHGEGGRASTVLGLNDLVTTELDALDVGVELLAREALAGLGQKGDDGGTGVTANNGDVLGGGVRVLDLGDEARGADNIEGGNTEQALGVVDTSLLEDLGGDGNSRVDLQMSMDCLLALGCATYGVGDDEDVGLGGVLSSGLGEVADDGGVGVEQIVTGHAGLAGNTSGDDNDLGTLEGSGEAGGSGIVAGDLRGVSWGLAGGGRSGVPRSWC